MSPSKSGGSTRAYSGGSPAIERSKSRIPDKCSSSRALSSPGSVFSSVKASACTASRMLRFRFTQPSSRAPNKRSNSRCGIISGGSARSYPAQLILRCMLSPNDSCATPICSERKRESPPILPAMIWSIDGPLGPLPVKSRPVIKPLMEFVWPLPLPLEAALSTPLSTCTSLRHAASGAQAGSQFVICCLRPSESSSVPECRSR